MHKQKYTTKIIPLHYNLLCFQNPEVATAHWLLSTAKPNASVPNQILNHNILDTPSTSTMPTPAFSLPIVSATTPTTMNPTTVHLPSLLPIQLPTQQQTQTARTAPTQADFLVPTNMIEHNLAVVNLMNGGITSG